MDKPVATRQDSKGQTSLELDLRHLDSNALAELEETALGAIVSELNNGKVISNTKHSSHSSYSAYSTYSMGPIG
jgi:hypothetical protein